MEEHKTSQKLAASALRMIDVSEKAVTKRRALARGSILMKKESVMKIIERTLPKGDVLTLAEAAGVLAAKKTPEILPLCHPLLIEAIHVRCHPRVVSEYQGEVSVECEVLCSAKTGAEMEALMGVNAALLCIYDLVKGVDPDLVLQNTFLQLKEGGKSGHWEHPLVTKNLRPLNESAMPDFNRLRVGIVVVSDRATTDASYDKTGLLIQKYFAERNADVVSVDVVSDDKNKIRDQAIYASKELRCDAVVFTGGTGISERDVTPDALEDLWTKRISGFGEAFRAKGMQNTANAWMSRAEAGLIEKTFVVTLPGSVGGVRDGLQLLDETLTHALQMIRGERHR